MHIDSDWYRNYRKGYFVQASPKYYKVNQEHCTLALGLQLSNTTTLDTGFFLLQLQQDCSALQEHSGSPWLALIYFR